MTHWIRRVVEYWNDKKLAEKCGLEVKEICDHESDGETYCKDFPKWDGVPNYRCKKCGEFYR